MAKKKVKKEPAHSVMNIFTELQQSKHDQFRQGGKTQSFRSGEGPRVAPRRGLSGRGK